MRLPKLCRLIEWMHVLWRNSGLLDTVGVHRTFDSLARLDSLSALSAFSVLNQAAYSYDAASRLDTVTSGANTASYGYKIKPWTVCERHI